MKVQNHTTAIENALHLDEGSVKHEGNFLFSGKLNGCKVMIGTEPIDDNLEEISIYSMEIGDPEQEEVTSADGEISTEEQGKGEDWDRFNTLAKICSRAEKLGISQGTRMTAMLDVDLADKRWHLRLHEWLASDDFNFIHDFVGIQNHVDRINKTFDNRFLPRFASQTV